MRRILTNVNRRPTGHRMKTITIALLAGASLAQAGCVNVTAPDKPIVITLNINVTQQVVYKLDGEAKSLIQANPGIF